MKRNQLSYLVILASLLTPNHSFGQKVATTNQQAPWMFAAPTFTATANTTAPTQNPPKKKAPIRNPIVNKKTVKPVAPSVPTTPQTPAVETEAQRIARVKALRDKNTADHANDKVVTLKEINDLGISLLISPDNKLSVTGTTYCPIQYLSFKVDEKSSPLSASEAVTAEDFRKVKARESVTLTFSPSKELINEKVTTLKECDDLFKNDPQAKKEDLNDKTPYQLPTDISAYANFSESPEDTIINLAKTDLFTKYQHFGTCSECGAEYNDFVTKNQSSLVKAYQAKLKKDEADKKITDDKKTEDAKKLAQEKSEKATKLWNQYREDLAKVLESFSTKKNLSPAQLNEYGKKLAELAKISQASDLEDDCKKDFVNLINDAFDTLITQGDEMAQYKDPAGKIDNTLKACEYVKAKADLYTLKANLMGQDETEKKDALQSAKDYQKGGKEYLHAVFVINPLDKSLQEIALKGYNAQIESASLGCPSNIESYAPTRNTRKPNNFIFARCIKLNSDMNAAETQLNFVNPGAAPGATLTPGNPLNSFAGSYLQMAYQMTNPQQSAAPVTNTADPKQTIANMTPKTQSNGLVVAVPTVNNKPYQGNPYDMWKADVTSNPNLSQIGAYTQVVSNK